MKKYKVTGMSCAACSARVEKAVGSLKGVDSCTVNLLTGIMTVEGNIDETAVIKAVEDAGYAVITDELKTVNEQPLKDREFSVLLKRLVSSLLFLVVLMYISMGYVMWGFPLPAFLSENSVAVGFLELLLTSIILVINKKFFINGFKSLFKLSPNMDTLVALGSSAAYIYSIYELFAMIVDNSHTHLHSLYFESAAMIVTLITVGKMLEAKSKGRTTVALKGLMRLAPKKAIILRNEKEVTVNIEEVKVGDVFIVKAGQSIPADGEVLWGSSAVDESALTGESIPIDKAIGDIVRAATICKSGFLKCKATRVGKDTTLSKIIEMVSDAASSKAPIARVADKVSGVFVPVVIAIALITTIIWLLVGQTFGYALARGISVLVISCPCALGLATPVAIMVGSGVGEKNGILFKTATILENAGKTDIVVLDKTGTVTNGLPQVTDIIGNDTKKLLSIAASIEKLSDHPLSIAVNQKAEAENISPAQVSDFESHTGNGVSAKIDGEIAVGGNLSFISKYCSIDDTNLSISEILSKDGKTPLFFSLNGEFLGIIAVADIVKKESKDAVDKLKKMGIRVVMLTGDNKLTAKAIANQVGIEEIVAQVMPDEKEEHIRALKKEGKVMMVGDGINDAPSLTAADTGVAMASGSDIACDSADIVLMNNKLTDIPAAITLSRKVLKNIHENLFWAFIYNFLGIPLAAGVFVSYFGWELNPMFSAAAMSLSSFCVVTNALRLNLTKIHNVKNIKQIKKRENKIMKIIKIEGMMCPHCEARVKSILEELLEVESAQVSHKEGTAVVMMKKEIADDTLKKIVTDAGYKVISIS